MLRLQPPPVIRYSFLEPSFHNAFEEYLKVELQPEVRCCFQEPYS